MSVIGLEVPHAHVHLVPIDSADDLNFTRPKLKMDQQALFKAQQRILEHLK
jgi:histidine triad (HIT) family protein